MRKRYFKIIMLCLIVSVITSLMSFVAFYGELREDKAENVMRAADYAANNIDDHTTDTETPLSQIVEDMKEMSQRLSQIRGRIEKICIYDSTDGSVSGDIDCLPEGLDLDSDSEHMFKDCLCTPYTYMYYPHHVTVWLINSNSEIRNTLETYAVRHVIVFILSFALICGVMAWILHMSEKHPEIVKVAYIAVFLWVVGMCAVFVAGMLQTDMEAQSGYIENRLSDIEDDALWLSGLSDSELEEECSMWTEQHFNLISKEQWSDRRMGYMLMLIAYDDLLNNSDIVFQPRDNIWDTSLPIESRVNVYPDVQSYTESLVDYILQTLMIGIFGSIMVMQMLSFDEALALIQVKRPKEIDDASFAITSYNADRMQHLLMVKTFSGTLITVYSVSMLKYWLGHDLGDYPAEYLTAIITLASVLACLSTYAVRSLYKQCGKIMTYVRIVLIVCAFGQLMCFLAQNCIVFITGYLITMIGDGFAYMIMVLYATAHNTPKEGEYAMLRLITSTRVGGILGSVAGGILAVLVSGEDMYLIAAICCIGLIFCTFRVRRENQADHIPENSGTEEIFKHKEAVLFFFLVVIPSGFQNWFFNYKISLDASAFGLTTVVVSFIYFMRNVLKLYVRASRANRKFWKRFSPGVGAALCLVLSSVAFFAYFALDNVISLILVSMVIAYVEASLNSRVYTYNFTLLEFNFNVVFGNSAGVRAGKQMGKTLAPVLIQAFGPIAVPALMLTGGGGSLLHQLRKKKKTEAVSSN